MNPYLALESLARRCAAPGEPLTPRQAERNVVKAIEKGLLKIMSKMGISTIQSYRGAQIFEAIGLAPDLIEQHFTGTPSRIGGIGLDVLARETLAAPRARLSRGDGGAAAGRRHLRLAPRRRAPQVEPGDDREAAGGRAPRRPPDATRSRPRRSNDETTRRAAPCAGCWGFKSTRDAGMPLDEVEPATEIVKRFATGAMSFGSLCARRTRRSPSR